MMMKMFLVSSFLILLTLHYTKIEIIKGQFWKPFKDKCGFSSECSNL